EAGNRLADSVNGCRRLLVGFFQVAKIVALDPFILGIELLHRVLSLPSGALGGGDRSRIGVARLSSRRRMFSGNSLSSSWTPAVLRRSRSPRTAQPSTADAD